MLGSMSKWVYDKSPIDVLKLEAPLAQLMADIAANGSAVFQKAIRQLLVENTHRTIVEMMPSKTLEAEQLKVSDTLYSLTCCALQIYTLLYMYRMIAPFLPSQSM